MLAIIFLAGLIGSLLSAMSAGGGALVIEPLLLLLGVEPAVAVGSTKIGAIGTMVASTKKFQKEGFLKWQLIWPFLVVAVLASIVGPLATTSLSGGTLELLIIIMAAVSLLVMIFRKNVGQNHKATVDFSTTRVKVALVLYFFGTALLAGLGAGLGIINSLILTSLVGFSYLQTTAVRRAVGIIALPIQAGAFALRGSVDWKIGIALLLAMSLGSYVGTHIAVRKGNRFVRRITIILSTILLIFLVAEKF